MRLIDTKTLAVIMLISSIMLFSISASQASNFSTSANSTSVLRFQQRMADKGNPEAQYKLAMMYESGTGVAINIEQAKTWYNKAAYQSFKPAKNRLAYLDIKQGGFKEPHKLWLKDLKHDARYGEGEAIFLLGQMYAYGTGVKQNTKKAVRILKKAVSHNISGAEFELSQAEKAYTQEQERKNIIERNNKRKQVELDALKKQQERNAQRQLLEQKRHNIEQKIIEQQRIKFAATYKDIEQKQALQKEKDIIRNERENEQTESNVCSGKNRFIATCR